MKFLITVAALFFSLSTFAAPPSAVTNLSANYDSGTGKITFSWTPPTGVVDYDLDVSADLLLGPGGVLEADDIEQVTGVSGSLTSRTYESFGVDEIWFFRITPNNQFGAGPQVVFRHGMEAQSAPSSPPNISYSESGGNISITAEATNASYLNFEYDSVNFDAGQGIMGNTHSYTRPLSDQPQEYRARACNTLGCSAWRSKNLGLDAVTNLAASYNAGTGKITFSWTPPAGVEEYDLSVWGDFPYYGGGEFSQDSDDIDDVEGMPGSTISRSYNSIGIDEIWVFYITPKNSYGNGPTTLFRHDNSAQSAPAGKPTITYTISGDNINFTANANASDTSYIEYTYDSDTFNYANGKIGHTVSYSRAVEIGSIQFTARACNIAGCTAWESVNYSSGSVSSISISPTNSSNGSHQVTWAAAAGATRYTLQRSFNDDDWTTLQDNLDADRTVDYNNLAAGKYEYRVRACINSSCGSYSESSDAFVAPSRPSSITISPANNSYDGHTVSWAASTDATKYTLQRSVDDGAWTTLQDNLDSDRTVVYTDLSEGKYEYRVRACYSNACSSYRESADGFIALTSVTNLVASYNAGTGKVTFSWTPPAGVEEYDIAVSMDFPYYGGGEFSIDGTDVEDITGVPGTTTSRSYDSIGIDEYWVFSIKPKNSSGEGASENIIYDLRAQSAPANKPTINYSVSGGNLNITATADAADTSYIEYKYVSSSLNTENGLIGNSHSYTRPLSEQPVRYEARACNSFGCSGWESVDFAPDSVMNVSAIYNDSTNEITFSWTTPAGVVDYDLDVSADLLLGPGGVLEADDIEQITGVSGSITSRTYDSSGVDEIWFFRITPNNQFGAGSQVVFRHDMEAQSAPNSPPNISYSESGGNISVTAEATNASYLNFEYDSVNFDAGQGIMGNTHSYTRPLSDQPQEYRAQACNTLGCSAWESINFGPDSVTGLAASYNTGTGKITFSWTPPADVDEYNISVSGDFPYYGSEFSLDTDDLEDISGVPGTDTSRSYDSTGLDEYWIFSITPKSSGLEGTTQTLVHDMQAQSIPLNTTVIVDTVSATDINITATALSNETSYIEYKYSSDTHNIESGVLGYVHSYTRPLSDQFEYYEARACNSVGCTQWEQISEEPNSQYSYHFLDTRNNGDTPSVYALVDGTEVFFDGQAYLVNMGEQVPVGTVNQGDVISSTEPLSIGSAKGGTDSPVPIELAGTDFVIPLMRNTHYFYVKNIAGTAVSFDYFDGDTTTSESIQPDEIRIIDSASTNNVGSASISNASGELLVSHRTSSNGDVYPVPPATLEVFGVRSGSGRVSVLSDSTVVTAYASNGNQYSYTRNADTVLSVDGGSGSEGRANLVRVVGDKPLAAVSYADSDGGEQSGFWPRSMFANRYILPVDTQYVAMGCIDSTEIFVYDASGAQIETHQCTSTGENPGKAYLGSHVDGVHLTAGTRIESLKPTYLIYEAAATSDEKNLAGALVSLGSVQFVGLPNTVDEGDIALSWSTVPGSNRIYNVEIDDGISVTRIYTGPETSFTDNRGAGIYAYGIRSCASVAELDCSDWVWQTVTVGDGGGSSTTVTGLTAEYSSYPHGLKLTWNTFPGTTTYEIARSLDEGVTWDYSYGSATEPEFIDLDIDDTSLTYSYRVRACSTGCSDWTSTPSAP